ncbi:MAG: epoxyqueuosine reductase [Candidatus Omnitrophota bacterium]|jgi:epoxyqueuosine reductase QueG|nr:MAG: epoxyqueuosine reductase [Candidatus Omnitrophota bacterium]
MDKEINYRLLKNFCLDSGMDLFGVADISKIKNTFEFDANTLKKLNLAVCLGLGLSRSVLYGISDKPTRLYSHHYRTVNDFLDQMALKAAILIQRKGFTALPVPASQILDWQSQKAHLSHKKLGQLAGLGWIGRNNLLVNKRLGSQFRIVSILTDMPLKKDKPVDDGCQNCMLCIRACPVKAIKKDRKDFNHIKCFEKLKEFARQHVVEQYICGVCVNVCRGELKNG